MLEVIALNTHGELLLMLRQQVGHSPAKARRFCVREAAPGHRDTEVSTLDRHQCILLFRAIGNTGMEFVKKPPSGRASSSDRRGAQRPGWERAPDSAAAEPSTVTSWVSLSTARACPQGLQCQGQPNTYKGGMSEVIDSPWFLSTILSANRKMPNVRTKGGKLDGKFWLSAENFLLLLRNLRLTRPECRGRPS